MSAPDSDPVSEADIRRLPKAEVHVHLEGCFEPADLAALAREAGEEVAFDDDDGMPGSDLAGLLRFLDLACALVRTPEQLARAVYRFAEREASSGVRYADLIVNPTHWPAWRDDVRGFLDAITGGLSEAEADGLPPIGLCVSLLRDQSAAEAIELAGWLIEHRHPRVVAMSLDGNEAAAGRTGPRFAEAFRLAAEAGLHRTVHAGESSGPEGVRDAIDLLRADRIDHGVRAIEDPDLVRELADRSIPLGVCPGSNVALGLYPNRAAHPIDPLRLAGVRVSINTDDPALFRTTLVEEYIKTAEAFQWDADTIRHVARTSIEASYCTEDVRMQLLAALGQWRATGADSAPSQLER
jgi:adenosine deaminase